METRSLDVSSVQCADEEEGAKEVTKQDLLQFIECFDDDIRLIDSQGEDVEAAYSNIDGEGFIVIRTVIHYHGDRS